MNKFKSLCEDVFSTLFGLGCLVGFLLLAALPGVVLILAIIGLIKII